MNGFGEVTRVQVWDDHILNQAGSGGLIEFELAIQVGADSFSLFLCHPHVNFFFVIPGPTEKIVRQVGPSEIYRRCKEKPRQKILPIW